MDRNDHTSTPHHMSLHERRLLDLDGVIEVEHFDEEAVVVNTAMGELTVFGRDLHVRQLNVGEGVLSIEGEVDSLAYRETGKRSGFLGRLLR